jgi:hypothetical protein
MGFLHWLGVFIWTFMADGILTKGGKIAGSFF